MRSRRRSWFLGGSCPFGRRPPFDEKENGRPLFSRLLQFQKQKLPENSVMIAFFGEFFIFWYVDMFSSFYL
ncbi:MAG: hypothetical protein C6W57_01020 [Caldibacillus debilis]|nr:MAG: hypothetical protein C6W57_01020 [Caldibacillus debilis]